MDDKFNIKHVINKRKRGIQNKIDVMEKRLEYLEKKKDERGTPSNGGYIMAKISAIKWAIELMVIEQDKFNKSNGDL